MKKRKPILRRDNKRPQILSESLSQSAPVWIKWLSCDEAGNVKIRKKKQ